MEPTLLSSEVRVWYLVLEQVPDGSWLSYRDLLSADERERAARFHFERDRRTYFAAHALVRTMLSQFLPVSPAAWGFTANAYGKPEIDQPVEGRGLRFNLSHTDGLVACAVAPARRVGVDVEAVDRRQVNLEIADAFFAPYEVRYLNGLAPDLRSEAFFEFWTLKESFIKAVGRGLSLALDSFAFELAPPRLAFAPESEGDPARWRFERLRPSARHRLAVAAEGVPDEIVHFSYAAVEPASLMPAEDSAGPGRISRK